MPRYHGKGQPVSQFPLWFFIFAVIVIVGVWLSARVGL